MIPPIQTNRLFYPRFGWRKTNPPKDYSISLTRADIDLRSLKPKGDVVTRIANRLIRNHNTSLPGFVVIPGTKHLVRTKKRAETFQFNLMAALQNHLERAAPHILLPQGDFAKDEGPKPHQAYYQGHTRETRKELHLDNMRSNITSVLYGPTRNIQGGAPCIADIQQFCMDTNLPQTTSALESIHQSTYMDNTGTLDTFYTVKPKYKKALQDYTLKLRELQFSQYPLLIFSNQLTEGILHGATPIRKKIARQPASRPITIAEIYYAPALKE